MGDTYYLYKQYTVPTLRSLSPGELNHLYRFWSVLYLLQKLQKDMETFTVDNQKLMQEHKWVYGDIPSLSSLQLFSFPRDWKKNKGLYKSVSCVLLLWPLTCSAWNGPREQSRLGRAHGLKACWYTSWKDDVKQHVECSWLLFLKFVVFSLWHAPCWFFYSWFLGEVTQPFLEPSEGARDRRIRTSAERDKWNGSIFSSLTLTPKLSWSKNSLQLLFSTRTGRR